MSADGTRHVAWGGYHASGGRGSCGDRSSRSSIKLGEGENNGYSAACLSARYYRGAVCAAQPSMKALVVAGVDPVAVSSDLSLAALTQLSEKSHRAGKHPPYGFYFGAVAYKIFVDIGNDDGDICKGPVMIRVTMRLTDRHIDIAQDLKNDACRFPKIAAHYRHHADSDVAVFERYVVKVTTTLGHLSTSSFAKAYQNDKPRQAIALIAQDAIEPILDEMDAERAALPSLVDTPQEVEKLKGTCSEHT
jgi:hypothetical protein